MSCKNVGAAVGFTDLRCDGTDGILEFWDCSTPALSTETAEFSNNCTGMYSLIHVTIIGYSGEWITDGIPCVTVDRVGHDWSNKLRLTNMHPTNPLKGTLEVTFSVFDQESGDSRNDCECQRKSVDA